MQLIERTRLGRASALALAAVIGTACSQPGPTDAELAEALGQRYGWVDVSSVSSRDRMEQDTAGGVFVDGRFEAKGRLGQPLYSVSERLEEGTIIAPATDAKTKVSLSGGFASSRRSGRWVSEFDDVTFEPDLKGSTLSSFRGRVGVEGTPEADAIREATRLAEERRAEAVRKAEEAAARKRAAEAAAAERARQEREAAQQREVERRQAAERAEAEKKAALAAAEAWEDETARALSGVWRGQLMKDKPARAAGMDEEVFPECAGPIDVVMQFDTYDDRRGVVDTKFGINWKPSVANERHRPTASRWERVSLNGEDRTLSFKPRSLKVQCKLSEDRRYNYGDFRVLGRQSFSGGKLQNGKIVFPEVGNLEPDDNDYNDTNRYSFVLTRDGS